MFFRSCLRSRPRHPNQSIIIPIEQDIPEPPESPEDPRFERLQAELEATLPSCPVWYEPPIIPVSARMHIECKVEKNEKKEHPDFAILDGRQFTSHIFELSTLLRHLSRDARNPMNRERLFPEDIPEFMSIDLKYIEELDAIAKKHGYTRKMLMKKYGISAALYQFLTETDFSKLSCFTERAKYRTPPDPPRAAYIGPAIFTVHIPHIAHLRPEIFTSRIPQINWINVIKSANKIATLLFITMTFLRYRSYITLENLFDLVKDILLLPLNTINYIIQDVLIEGIKQIPEAAITFYINYLYKNDYYLFIKSSLVALAISLGKIILPSSAMSATFFAAIKAFVHMYDLESWSTSPADNKLIFLTTVLSLLFIGLDGCGNLLGLTNFMTPDDCDPRYLGLVPIVSVAIGGLFGRHSRKPFSMKGLTFQSKSEGELAFEEFQRDGYEYKRS